MLAVRAGGGRVARVLVDTSGWLALINKNDEFHGRAVEFIKDSLKLATSSWVVEELVAHLQVRYGVKQAKLGLEMVLDMPELEMMYMDDELMRVTSRLFEEKGSARISLVDVSNVVIAEREGIETVFGFDRRFETMFGLEVAPN